MLFILLLNKYFSYSLIFVAMNKLKTDPWGDALKEYLTKPNANAEIIVRCDITEEDIIPVPYLFRKANEFPEIESKAIALAQGNVLDIGAGAGCHSIVLQNMGRDVTALDLSPGACQVMKERGIRKVVCDDIFSFNEPGYDSILLLMNGVGVGVTLEGIAKLLQHLKKLLNPGGKIILDSSDILYMFVEEDGSVELDLNAGYYGQVQYQVVYKDIEGVPFDWVFVDPSTMSKIAEENGFTPELIMEDDHYAYLMTLTNS
jgi:SAM-dependent methyltransferase